MNHTPPPTLESELLSGLYTEDEKAQILGQIEEAASANRLTVDAEAFQPRKRGILFPIAVNLAAVVLIVGAWFGASAYFQTKQQGLQLKTDKMFSTESKLLAKVLEDSKKQLAAKNAEIEKIQGDMAQLAAEKAELQKSFSNRVADRERALRKERDDAVAAERQRLRDAGYGAAEVEKRLRDFEAQKNAEFSARIAEYRRQVQAEIDQRSQAVVALQSRLQASVTEQEQLRKTIETQTKEREKDLQTQLSSQAADLDRLKRERDELAAFQRSAEPATTEVRAAFDAGDPVRTQAALASLRQTLARAGGSPNELIRNRAQADLTLASALDGAVALWSAGAKAGSDQALEIQRTQARKDQESAGLLLGETQKSLTSSEQRLRQAALEAEGLRQAVAAALAQLESREADLNQSQADAQALSRKVSELEASVADLTPYKTRFDTLQTLFSQSYPSPRDRFTTTLGSEAGRAQFPGYEPAWAELEALLQEAGPAATIRRLAFEDVLSFTDYLRGTSPSAQAARETAEKLSRNDETYRRVVEDIQALAVSGAGEAVVTTDQVQLYGTVASVSGNKIVLEPLTKVKPAVGQMVELRRVQGKKETALGRGTVLTVSDRKTEIEWTQSAVLPLSGDPAYLVLP